MTHPALVAGVGSGNLDLEDWDYSVVRQLNALLDEEKNQYYLPLNGIYREEFDLETQEPVQVNRALVIFKKPEPVNVEMEVPLIVINRDEILPAPKRYFNITTQYRVPSFDSTAVAAGGTVGANYYESREQEQPYDFMYSIDVWDRSKTTAQMLLLHVMLNFPLRGSLKVTDSVGCERVYASYQEGVSDLTEVESMVNRLVGYGVSVRLEGELTLDRVSLTIPAFTGERSTTPFDPNDPSPGPGGLYGTGKPVLYIKPIYPLPPSRKKISSGMSPSAK